MTSASIATCTMKEIASRKPANSKVASILLPFTDQSLRDFNSVSISAGVSILWAIARLLDDADAARRPPAGKLAENMAATGGEANRDGYAGRGSAPQGRRRETEIGPQPYRWASA